MAAPFALFPQRNDEQILNYCTKHLARGVKLFSEDVSSDSFNLSTISENWRFPIVEPALDDNGGTGTVNRVTLVWMAKSSDTINSVRAIGSFVPWYESIELTPVKFEDGNTNFYACQLMLPVGKSYYYKFIINGIKFTDPINPQIKILSNGKQWSFFFTDFYNASEEFEAWEISLLYRLANQIVPFRTKEAQNFINRFYLSLTKPEKHVMPIYKLDDSVGEVNFITNILVKEERHHLSDYKICLSIIDQLLRKRNPTVDSWTVSEELINELYDEMATGNVPDWDYAIYNNPRYFLSLIRRHTLTGAFSHPRYGGNIGGVGWKYLQEKFDIKNDTAQVTGNYFNWQLSMEKPIGNNEDYKG
jgi:Gluconate 2-dehydrogenase subunit 3